MIKTMHKQLTLGGGIGKVHIGIFRYISSKVVINLTTKRSGVGRLSTLNWLACMRTITDNVTCYLCFKKEEKQKVIHYVCEHTNKQTNKPKETRPTCFYWRWFFNGSWRCIVVVWGLETCTMATWQNTIFHFVGVSSGGFKSQQYQHLLTGSPKIMFFGASKNWPQWRNRRVQSRGLFRFFCPIIGK